MPINQEIKANTFKGPEKKSFLTRKNIGRSVHSLLDGSFLTRKRFMQALPFILFLMLLGVIYISNIFKVEKTKRQLDDLEEELRELRYEYVSSRSKLMYESKPSEVSLKLKDTGIRESVTPPVKIVINTDKQAHKP